MRFTISGENTTEAPHRFGDRSTSDVVVRLRTDEGRDDWICCHSHVLKKKSKYFADRLSQNWPTCQILDSRYCVEVYCQESQYDHHINFLRLLYEVSDGSDHNMGHGVKNALGILRVATELGCPTIVNICVSYLEAVPWEESEEEEILRTIPGMGSEADPILARLKPVHPSAVMRIFRSAIRFATSSPPSSLNDIKSSAQEQLEYMITEDDDAPLLIADDEIKVEVMECMKRMFTRFSNLLEAILMEPFDLGAGNMQTLLSVLADLCWVCQMLTKLEIMRDFVSRWIDSSDNVIKVVELVGSITDATEIRYKVIEVAAKVLEAIGYGTVVLPTPKRLQMVKAWLPFVITTKPLIDSVVTNEEEAMTYKIDGELWQVLESSFVSIILALPSTEQADILTEWLRKSVRYPDLTEAFEVWCYRSKVAKRRLSSLLEGSDGMSNSSL